MPRVHHLIPSFNAGELTESIASRFNVEKVASGCRSLKNMIPHVHGPAVKRPGMEWMGDAAHASAAPRLMEFVFSATTRFIIEFAPGALRFWSNGQLVMRNSVPLTVPHPYTHDEAFAVQHRQVNDVVYFVHPNYHPQRLTRLADDRWTLEPMALRYPPLLDQYFEKESVATPTVTPVWTAPTEEAPEFSVFSLPIPTIASTILGPQTAGTASVAKEWVTVAWAGWPLTAPEPKGVWLEIRKPTGEWLRLPTALVSAVKATPPPEAQIRFKAVTRDLVPEFRTRVSAAAAWGAWAAFGAKQVAFFAVATAVAPALEVRVVVTDDKTPALPTTKCVLMPFSGNRLEVPLVPVIQAPHSAPFVATWTGFRSMTWEVYDATAWVPLYTQATAPAGAQTLRLRHTGTTLALEGQGAAGGWEQLAVEAMPSAAAWRLRLATLPAGLGVDGKVSVTGAATHERRLVYAPEVAGDVGKGGVTVRKGKWQVRVAIPDGVAVPTGATARLQRWDVSSLAWSNVTGAPLWTLTSPGVFDFDGTSTRVLTADTLCRVLYDGGASKEEVVGGAMVIESVTFPASSSTTLSVDNESGDNRVITSTQSLFDPDHRGAYFEVAHRRELSFSELRGTAEKASASVRVVGRWDVFTYGTWTARLLLERRTPSNAWEILRSWSSKNDRNIIAGGETDQDTDLRLRLDDGATGTDGPPAPRFLLEASDARTYGLVRVTALKVQLATTALGDAWEGGLVGVDWEWQATGAVTRPYSRVTARCDVVRVLASQEPTTLWAEGAWSEKRGYPAAIGIHEGRLWFGGSKHQPSALWASVSNDFESFRRGTNDDASFVVALAAETASYIRWLSSANDALLIGTGGEEWSIVSNVQGQPITPTNIKAGRRAAYSSASLPARVTQDATLFVKRNRRQLMMASYSATEGAFSASDMTVLASHVFGSGIRQLAVQTSPQTIVWAVLNDGTLAGMTFEREQNVFGWSVVETAGLVRSVAVIAGEVVDEVWLSVERGGRAHIERFDPVATERVMSRWHEMMHVDHARRFIGLGTISVPHLAGLDVVGLVDGQPFALAVPASGVVSLAGAVSMSVVIGLPYRAQLQPMRIDLPLDDGTAQGRNFRVSRVTVRVLDSCSGQVADAPDGVFESLPYPHGQGLHTGLVECPLESQTRDEVSICVNDSSPFPFAVAALTIKMDVYGE